MKNPITFREIRRSAISSVVSYIVIILVTVLTLYAYFFINFSSDKAIIILLGVIIGLSVMLASQVAFLLNKSSREHIKIAKEINSLIDQSCASISQFSNYEEQSLYLDNAFQKAGKVEDLTWSNHHASNNPDREAPSEYVKKAGVNNTYYEVFIFDIIDGNNQSMIRKDRLKTLKYHYECAKTRKKKSKYSCGYYEKSLLPRIQFTIIDEKKIVFTSKTEGRLLIENNLLISLFNNLYDQIWDKSKKLIINGDVVKENEDIIKDLVREI